MDLVVATHNLMDGRRLGGLLDNHEHLQATVGLDLLCIQENRRADGEACAPLIGERLGGRYEAVGDHPRTRLAILFDRSRLELAHHEVHELPRLDRLSRFERMFIGGSTPQQKFVQIAEFVDTDGNRFTVANFHLDTAGGNGHRSDQVAALSRIVTTRSGRASRLLACGDTNAFAVRRDKQLASLAAVLEPLAQLGAVDPGESPTHFFARQREPKLTHRLVVALGRLGLDVPGRYDVVCTNLETHSRGQLSTPDSDHDLVWARLTQ